MVQRPGVEAPDRHLPHAPECETARMTDAIAGTKRSDFSL